MKALCPNYSFVVNCRGDGKSKGWVFFHKFSKIEVHNKMTIWEYCD